MTVEIEYFKKGQLIAINRLNEFIHLGDKVQVDGHVGEVYYNPNRSAFMVKGGPADGSPCPFNEDFSNATIYVEPEPERPY